MRNLELLPLEEVTWDDIQSLVGKPETTTLEFKSDLHSKKGGTHSWHTGGDLDPPARDEIADEIVAFANAWGGTVIIGLVENRDTPRQCTGSKLLPRAKLLADRLEAQLRGIIDPPLASLTCRAVLRPGKDDCGVILVRTPRSALAPHGRINQAAAFVRRGTSKMPMSMRDLQNVFWEARTRVQKIEEARKRADRYLDEQCVRSGILWALGDQPDPHHQHHPGVYARFCAYPHEPLELGTLDVRESFARSLRFAADRLIEEYILVPLGDGQVDWRPRPMAHGFDVISKGPSRWTVRDDGSIEVFGFVQASNLEGARHSFVHPYWFMAPVAQILAMIEILRREAGRPGVPFEVDCSLRPVQAGSHHSDAGMFGQQEGRQTLPARIDIGPFLYQRAEGAGVVFGSIERELWHGLGIPARAPLTFSLDLALDAFQALKHR